MRLLIVSLWLLAQTLPAADSVSTTVAPGASVVLGPANGVIITRENKHLAIYGDPRKNPPAAERVLFTHHRRDVAWAGRGLVEHGAEAVVPAAEKALFADVEGFWNATLRPPASTTTASTPAGCWLRRSARSPRSRAATPFAGEASISRCWTRRDTRAVRCRTCSSWAGSASPAPEI